jgi:predicted metalloprotease
MRWRGRRQSDNIEDRRGGAFARGGAGRKVGGGAAVLVVIAGLVFGEDVSNILGFLLGEGRQPVVQQQSTSQPENSRQNDEAKQFVSVVLAETEDTWNGVFQRIGKSYQPPKLVLYEGRVQSACGVSSAASGPFYCPGDYQVYIDLSFLGELRNMGASGDFAFAYVIAHEVGHHVQNLVGIASQVRQQQSRATRAQANALSVRMELQADCLAGVWINHTENRSAILEPGDIEEGLRAAAAVGDDTILKRAGRAPRREAFTHGSSEERMNWFRQGMQTGDIESCNTFG